MNTKRQTIWLVSMLGLMVVLSAYYLFTDNPGEIDVVNENGDLDESVIDAVEVDEHSDLNGLEQQLADEDHAAADADDHGDEVLDKVQAGAQTGEELLASIDMKRTEALQKETEELMEIALDSKKSTEEIAKAQERLRMIEETQAKVSDLEDQLMREYENVVISEEKGRWNVIVQTDKLQRSQAVTIIDMLVEQLQVTPGKVAVEYVS